MSGANGADVVDVLKASHGQDKHVMAAPQELEKPRFIHGSGAPEVVQLRACVGHLRRGYANMRHQQDDGS